MRTLMLIGGLCLGGTALAQPATAWLNEPGGVSIAADAADNVVTVRWDYNPAGDIYVAKRNAGGALLWEARYDNTDSTRHEVATWVDTDSAGSVLVSGTIRSGYSSPVNANSVLMKFSPAGALLWRRVYDAAFDGSSTRKLLVDASDNVYVLGLGTGPSGQVSTVRKFSPAGDTLWAWFDDRGIGAPLNIKWSGDGALLLSARGIFGSINGYAKIGRDGATIWSLPGISSLTAGDAAGDAGGNSYLVNGNYSAGGSLLRKVSPAGATLWERSHPIAGFRVEADGAGAVVVSGFPNAGSAGAAFVKYGAGGDLLWANLDADGPAVGLLAHAQMKLDAAGNAYLAAGTMSQMGVTKVRDSDGSSDWTQILGSGYAAGLALGQAQQVYVVGGIHAARIDQAGEPPPPSADLALTLTDTPDPAVVGADLVYQATVVNRGPAPATGTSLSLTLPGKITFVGVASTQGSCSGAPALNCALGTLAPGAQATVTATVRPRARGSLAAGATVNAAELDPERNDNTASATTTVRRR